MSVTFVDVAGSTLPSTTEPLDFTTTLDVVAISVSFGSSRPEERVYRDGAFLYPYLRSTQSGHTFSLIRDGGWPGNPSVHVDENSTPTAGLAWGAIYDLDLTAQANQTMTTAGSYTIDGKTWWAKGTLGSTGALCSLVNGSGLRLFEPASIDVAHRALWRGTGATQAFTARVLALKLDQIADFNPLAPYAVQWRFTSPANKSADASRCPIAGVMDVVASSAALTGASKDTSKSVGIFATSNGYFIRSPHNGSSDVDFGPSALGTSYAGTVQGIVKFSTNRYYPLAGTWSGSMGKPDDYTSFNANVTPAFLTQSLSTAPSFFFCLDKASSDGQTLDIYLTHLRVLQPKVP